MKEKFNTWWSGLSSREKKIVAVGGSLLLVFIIYKLIWQPSLERVEHLRETLSASQKMLLWMQEADKKIGGTAPRVPAVSSMVLLSEVKKEINQAALEKFLTQLKQSGNEMIEMHFQSVEFNALIKLLAEMIKKEGVHLAKISVTSAGTSGYVNADIGLQSS